MISQGVQVLKIVVCLKQVPDTETRVKLAPDGRHIDLTGASLVVNPYDEFAVEEALKLKEAAGSGEVIVLTLGPAGAGSAIRNALAMGADRGVLLRADLAEADGRSIAAAMAEKLKEIGPDLILCGKQAIDSDGAQVGPRLAELLSLPCVTVVTKLEIQDGK